MMGKGDENGIKWELEGTLRHLRELSGLKEAWLEKWVEEWLLVSVGMRGVCGEGKLAFVWIFLSPYAFVCH